MASDNSGERRGLQQSLRSHTGYGTASLAAASNNKSTPKTRKCILRRILRTDTLMGIALKYGVPIQILKKENKLWNNDHLFLRETLLIPLTPENEDLLDENDTIIVCNGSSSNIASPSSPHSRLPNGDITDSSPSSHQSLKAQLSSSSGGCDSDAAATIAPSRLKPSASTDFFAKYDNSIARLKGDVAKMERNTANLEGIIDTNPLALPPRRGSGTSRRDSNSSTSSANERRSRFLLEDDNSSSPILLIRSRTNSRHVKSTIENHQQVNDDLYEL